VAVELLHHVVQPCQHTRDFGDHTLCVWGGGETAARHNRR
jgi:hypothetical protein